MSSPLRLLLVDDHPVVRDGVAAITETQPDMEVVGEAGDGEEAIDLALELKPDVVLMDLRLPRVTGVEAIRRIRSELPHAHILILTTYDSDESILEGLQAGAEGYLLKGSSRQELLSAIRAVARGESPLPPAVAGRLISRLRSGVAATELSARELEVLKLVAQGKRNREIADDLFLSEKTVKAHVSSILRKLNAEDRTEAVTIGLRRGLISL
ncbi:MAG: response regulator transcription factor [Chloroflexota bacterium]|nr:response regulator transcription factor [Chloroflexota bacterium]